jgi:hypothetical protein
VNVLLAGEGPDELGQWAEHPSYREDPPRLGILEALLRRVRDDGWRVRDGVRWKDIRLYQPGGFRSAETRKVMRLLFRAVEEGYDVVVFSRDRDGDPQRHTDVERGIHDARAEYPDLRVVGGVAREEIEAWVLALLGQPASEGHTNPKEVLSAAPHGIGNRDAKVAAVEAADMSRLPDDAESLHRWLERARAALVA